MSEHVMVPVPEEFHDATKQFLMALDMRANAARAGDELDQNAVDRMLRVLDPRCRTALLLAAPASLAGRNLTVADLAASTGWTTHDAAGVLTELSALVWTAFGPMINIAQASKPDVAAGSINWNERLVVVWKQLATAVVAADERPIDGT